MSTYRSTASEEKLLYYSTIRKRAKHGDRIASVEVEQILSNMATDLTCEDRFVVYGCQRAFAAILKTYKLQDLSVIQDILQNWSQGQHHSVCLEICSELLSRPCKLCQFYAEQLSKPLSRYSLEFFKEKDYKAVLIWNTSCLYCLLKIYYKYTKLVSLYNCTDALRFIRSILHDYKSTLIDILFSKEVPEYIGRRLIRFLCSLLRCDNCERNGDLYSEILLINDLLIKALSKMDLEEIVCKTSICVFTGQNNCTDPIGHAMDMVHLREWSFFIISSLALKCSQDLSIAVQILNRLDSVVKKTLGFKNNILLTWIAEVFCDQDDKWIELLLILMTMSSQRSELTESAQINNHWYFLQFMSYTVLDHLVLIDFLTSPETNFLQYLTSYLKYLLTSWTEFQRTVDIFDKRLCQEQHIDITGSTVSAEVMTTSPVALKEKTLCFDKVLCKVDPLPDGLPEKINVDQVIGDEHLFEVDDFCGKINETSSKIQTEVKDKQIEPIKTLGEVTASKNLHGLGMICKAYRDSEDTDDCGDDTDNEIHVESGEAENDSDLDHQEKHIMDSVMSTLIRVRFKLESLWENNVIGYNPNPLVKLLEQIENVYENG